MMVRSVAMNIKMTVKSAWPHQHSTGIMAVMEGKHGGGDDDDRK